VEKKENNNGSVSADQMILNALKKIEHKNHPLSPAQVEEIEVTSNMKTNAVDTHSRYRLNKRLIKNICAYD